MRLILLLLVLTLIPTPTCFTGQVTRHEAWDSVFSNFPERLRSDVHGYIATADCNEMGDLYDITVGDDTYRVAVADCLNRSLRARPGWIGDLDSRIWYAADLPNAPTPARLCRVSQ